MNQQPITSVSIMYIIVKYEYVISKEILMGTLGWNSWDCSVDCIYQAEVT